MRKSFLISSIDDRPTMDYGLWTMVDVLLKAVMIFFRRKFTAGYLVTIRVKRVIKVNGVIWEDSANLTSMTLMTYLTALLPQLKDQIKRLFTIFENIPG